MGHLYTSSLRIVQEEFGDNENSWDTLNNVALTTIDDAISGQVTLSLTAGDVMLATAAVRRD